MFFKKMYLKWVIGHCRHLCCFCKYYSYNCDTEMRDYLKDKTWNDLRHLRNNPLG